MPCNKGFNIAAKGVHRSGCAHMSQADLPWNKRKKKKTKKEEENQIKEKPLASMYVQYNFFENMGKGEIARYEQFLLFP